MLKITATRKKNMFWFNTAEGVGSRQPPPHRREPLMLLRGQDGGQLKSSRAQGHLDVQTRRWGRSRNSPAGPSWGESGWARDRAARGHPWAG